MVTITEYKMRESQDGKPFFVLILQSGMELVRSSTGSCYLTAKKVSLPTTFDELTCQSMVGTQLPGCIQKVETAPYEYTIQETGEVVMLTHRWEYVDTPVTGVVKDFTPQHRPFNGIEYKEAA